MLIKEMILGRKLEILVDRDGYTYRLVSKVEGTVEGSVAVSAIVAKGRMFRFEDTDDVTIIYRGGERMWRWNHVKTGLARLEGETVHTFSSREPGEIYNRRESFRVPIGESLLMYRVEYEKTEDGEDYYHPDGSVAKLRVCCSSMYFEKSERIEWKLTFQEKCVPDIKVKLI